MAAVTAQELAVAAEAERQRAARAAEAQRQLAQHKQSQEAARRDRERNHVIERARWLLRQSPDADLNIHEAADVLGRYLFICETELENLQNSTSEGPRLAILSRHIATVHARLKTVRQQQEAQATLGQRLSGVP